MADSSKNTILIVDDSPSILNLLAEHLRLGGYEVLLAEDGEQALARVNETRPDLILLDVMMPRLNGLETCRRLKENNETGDIPVIFLTAMTDMETKLEGFESGAVDFVTKPIQRRELLARINTHLTIRNLQKELQAHNQRLQNENAMRRRVQDALRESRERYRLLAENSTDIISRQTGQGVYLYVSPACQNVLGYAIEEMVGRPAIEFVDPQALAALPQLSQSLETWPPVSTLTYPTRRKDNTCIWLETTTRLIRDEESGLVVEAIAVSRDVTARKTAEDALKKAHDELEDRVRVRTAELDRTNKAYSRFVPHEFLHFLNRNSILDVHLGDQVQQDMTILFADIRAFTTMSEAMTPQENFSFLNSYLNQVSPIIREHHGFIDKYIGDAVMALFPQKPEDALKATIAMRQEISNYNQERRRQNRPSIKVGFGIHTGTLMLGIIGEAERMEGTVISDAVNLASRLEHLTKLYGVSILISQDALFGIERPSRYRFRFLDRVQVAGKTEAVSVFEIFDGEPAETIALKMKTRTDFEKGLLHYHSQEFAQAEAHFAEVLRQNPQDKAAQLYLKRTAYFAQYGVPPEWDGIEALGKM